MSVDLQQCVGPSCTSTHTLTATQKRFLSHGESTTAAAEAPPGPVACTTPSFGTLTFIVCSSCSMAHSYIRKVRHIEIVMCSWGKVALHRRTPSIGAPQVVVLDGVQASSFPITLPDHLHFIANAGRQVCTNVARCPCVAHVASGILPRQLSGSALGALADAA